MNESALHYSDDEIDLRELIATVWQGKWTVLACTIIFAAAGVAYALFKPNIYEASILLAPAQDESNVNGIGGQLGGLASLAGINIGSGSSNKTVIAKETLQSRAFLTDFIHRHNLRVPLMASKSWSMSAQEWVIDQSIFNQQSGEWQHDKDGESLEPTNWDMVKRFRELLSVRDDKDTGLVTVTIASESPVAAQQWLELLIKDINEHMRQQDVREAEASIAYLEGKLRETNISGMQQVFYQLIENETRTVMLANAQREYVFETVDPAVIPQEKSEPKRGLIVSLTAMLGCMVGMLAIFVTVFLRSTKENTEMPQTIEKR